MDEYSMVQPFLSLLKKTIIFALRLFTLALEVFTRHKFGERQLRWWLCLFSGVVVCMEIVSAGSIANKYSEMFRSPFGEAGPRLSALLFGVIYSCACFYHLREIGKRRKRGARWHSRSPGLPWPFLGADNRSANYGLIPLFGLLMGAIFAPLSFGVLACMVPAILFSMALFWFREYTWRTRVLDAIDSQIQADWFTQAFEKNDPERQDGLVIPQVMLTAERQRFGSKVGSALVGLDPRLRGIRSMSDAPK